MPGHLTQKEFKEKTDKLIATLTSNEMIERMKAFKTLAPEDRLAEAGKLLSVEALKERGVEFPEGFRLSSRYFEDEAKSFEFGNVDGDATALATLMGTDPDFVKRLEQKYPDVYANLKVTSGTDVAMLNPGVVALGACGGIGGTIGGTGGCACGGVSE